MKKRILAILVILSVLALIGNIYLTFNTVQRIIKQNREIANSEVDFRYFYIQKQIKDLTDVLNKRQEDSYKKLEEKITQLPKVEQTKKEALEYRLRQATVVIYNKTIGAMGSGVTLKYKGKFYILSAGHMAEKETDILTFGENGFEINELEIVKHAYTLPQLEENGDFTKGEDLILLKPKNKNIQPKFYVELEDNEISPPAEIYIVGNPAGIEDVLSEGRIIAYMNNFIYYINHTYYGNSGGGIYTKEGKLIGIVSHMYPIGFNYETPPYMTYGAVRLNKIFEFLKDVE